MSRPRRPFERPICALIPARPSPADIEAALPTLNAARRMGKDFAFVLNQAPARSFRLREAAEALTRMGVLALPYIVQRLDHRALRLIKEIGLEENCRVSDIIADAVDEYLARRGHPSLAQLGD
jgi:hypothetical protein